MKKDFSGDTAYDDDDTRQAAMKSAAATFIANVGANYSEDGDHRMAIVTFSTSATTQKGWTTVDASGVTALQSTINNLGAPSGDTYVNTGLTNASNLLNDNSYNGTNAERNKIVIVFTDGMPAPNGTDHFSTSIANPAIATAKTLKESGVTIYTIGIFSGANVDQLYGTSGFTTSGTAGAANYTWYTSSNLTKSNNTYYSKDADIPAGNRFLNYLSSNYKSAADIGLTEYSYDENGYYGQKTRYRGWTISANYEKTGSGYYLTASDSDSLTAIFQKISESIATPSTSVTLNADSVLKDVMANGLTMPETAAITVKTYEGTVNNGSIVKGSETETAKSLTTEIADDRITATVTGFDYSNKYIAEGHPGEILQVQITGVVPSDESVTNSVIATNDSASGIYAADADTPAVTLPQPTTILTSKSYVLDYAKTTALTDLGQTTSAVIAVPAKVDNTNASLTGTYGNVSLSGGTLSYTPITTNWDGYDTFYAFGKTTDASVTTVEANKNGNLWSKVNVIPANNVYYEDDFITSEDNGTVGIVYTGEWTVDGTTADNTETANGDVQGWEKTLADDTGYSDGSAHKAEASSKNQAKATFEFTGTGVDIYSRTDTTTGTILVMVTGETSNGDRVAKSYAIDNKALSNGTDGYYQIPTFTYSGEYGTYKVTLMVTTAAGDRCTYYLDGIRVYNPIKTEDETVQNAYGADEINAVFTEVRGKLDTGSVAFIDEDENSQAVAASYTDTETGKLAPNHEVYLSKGQSVSISVADENSYYVGLKAPNGTTTASLTNGSDDSAATATIGHASDLYYKVTPTNGYITIKNTGDNLLSVTKIRSAGENVSADNTGILTANAQDAVQSAVAMRSASLVAYSATAATYEELEAEETPAVTEPETVESEGTVTEEPGEVIIDNPEVSEQAPAAPASRSLTWVKDMFSSIRNIFGRR